MTIQTKSTNSLSRDSERASSLNEAAERRPLSQYILAERAADEERADGDAEFGWTIFDSDSDLNGENENARENAVVTGRDLSVLKRIKRFLNDDVRSADEENGAIDGGSANDKDVSSESKRVVNAGASFFDVEEVAAPTRNRVAYPFYDGTQNSATNDDLRREPSFVVDCAADSELVFEPRNAWNGSKRRVRKEKKDATNVEKTKNEAFGENNEIEQNAKIAEDALVGEFGKSAEDASGDEILTVPESASIGEVASVPESAPIGEVATASESASIGEVAPVPENASIGEVATVSESAPIGEVATAPEEIDAPRTFVVDFSETIVNAAVRKSTKLEDETEKTTIAFSERRKKIKTGKISKTKKSVLENENAETTNETLEETAADWETTSLLGVAVPEVLTTTSGNWSEVVAKTFDSNADEIKDDEMEKNVAAASGVDEINWRNRVVCANSANEAVGEDCAAEASNARAANLTKIDAPDKLGKIEKNNGVERSFNDGRARTTNGRTTIFQRFVQLVASSERESRNRNRGGSNEFLTEKRTNDRRQNGRFEDVGAFEAARADAASDFAPQNDERVAFGEVVSLVVAPNFAEFDEVSSTWATASFSTFDAVWTGGKLAEGDNLGSF